MKMIAFAILVLAAVFGLHFFGGDRMAVAKLQQGGAGTGPNGMLTCRDIPLQRTFTVTVPASSFQPCGTVSTQPAYCFNIPISNTNALVIDDVLPISLPSLYASQEESNPIELLVNGTLVYRYRPNIAASPAQMSQLAKKDPILVPAGSVVTIRAFAFINGFLPSVVLQGAVLDAAWL